MAWLFNRSHLIQRPNGDSRGWDVYMSIQNRPPNSWNQHMPTSLSPKHRIGLGFGWNSKLENDYNAQENKTPNYWSTSVCKDHESLGYRNIYETAMILIWGKNLKVAIVNVSIYYRTDLVEGVLWEREDSMTRGVP